MPDKKRILITGRAKWPKLNEPDAFKPGDTPYYKVDLILTPEEAKPIIAQLEEAYEAGYQYHLNKEGKARLKKSSTRPWFEEEEKDGSLTGQMIFRCKARGENRDGCKLSLLVVDSATKPMTEQVGGGSLLRVAGDPYVWFVGAHGVGISLQMAGVQVLELHGGASPRTAEGCGFTAEEGFETASAAMATAPVGTDEDDAGDDF